jgi:hypothetical protein
VEDLREMPIPLVRHAIHHGRESGGIHVRRSPFDAKVIDILFFDTDGRDLPPGKTQSIERLFSREDFPRAGPDGTGDLNFPARVVEGYREHFLQEIDGDVIAERRFNLVMDFAYGTTVAVLPGLLGKLRAEVVSLNAYAAPGRLSRTEQEFQESLDRLGGIVRSITPTSDSGSIPAARPSTWWMTGPAAAAGDDAVALRRSGHAPPRRSSRCHSRHEPGRRGCADPERWAARCCGRRRSITR